MAQRRRENWGTRIGVILAVMGSAVGLGNFLRFPGLAAKYEGGAFMIPYFIALLLLGLPLSWAEWALGRYGGSRGYNSAAGIYRTIWKHPAAPWFGMLGMLIPVIIFMYYILIESWCLGYALFMARGTLADMGISTGKFFVDFVGAAADGTAVHGGTGLFLLGFCFIVNLYLIYRGLNKGIEWFNRWAMPLLILCALVVLARVLTLGTPDPARPHLNLLSGLGFMWNPRTANTGFFEALCNGQMWLEAAGQIFFSLSAGFGIIVNYASYVRESDDIALSALTSAAGNEFCEVALGGLITIPAAFVFLGAADVIKTVDPAQGGGTFNLGFVTLPHVFRLMPLGAGVGAIFFFLLFLAALTSSLSMLQPAIALLEEGLGLGRRTAVSLLGFVCFVGAGFVLYFSKDLTALATFDFWAGTFLIYLLATFQVILFGWIMGIEKGYAEIERGAEIRVPRIMMFIIKYISPVYLLAVFGIWVWQQITATKDNYIRALATDGRARLAFAFIVAVGVFFALLVGQSVRRWRAAEARQGAAS